MGKSRQSGSLLITRVMVGILLVSIGRLYWSYRQHTALLEKLRSHAWQIYPYLPKLDRHFDFTVDFYGVQISGNTRTDYELYFTGASEKPELYFLRDLVARITMDPKPRPKDTHQKRCEYFGRARTQLSGSSVGRAPDYVRNRLHHGIG